MSDEQTYPEGTRLRATSVPRRWKLLITQGEDYVVRGRCNGGPDCSHRHPYHSRGWFALDDLNGRPIANHIKAEELDRHFDRVSPETLINGIWMIELSLGDGTWEVLCDAGRFREPARLLLATHRQKWPREKYRLRKYVPTSEIIDV